MDRTELLSMDKLDLVGHIAKLERELALYRQVPDRDQLQAELEELLVINERRFEDFRLGFRRARQLDKQLRPTALDITNPRYGWTSGELNLMLQYVIHQYMPPTDDSGEPTYDEHIHEFGWTLINMLDGELDHGVYHRDQVLEEVARGHGWEEGTDLNWWLNYSAQGKGQRTAVYKDVEANLQAALHFNLQELRRQLSIKEDQ